MKVRPHKFGSVTHRLKLGPEVELSRMVDVRVGQVLAVRALEEKRVYDVVELPTGRMAHVSQGDVLVGALGRRDALRGFVGRVPEKVKAGDTLNVLNLGVLLGEAIGETKEVGHALRVEVLGMVVNKEGRGVNIADAAMPDPAPDAQIPPVIVVSGSCMNSGKTYAACEVISRLSARGYVCAGVKCTGVAAMKDLLNMTDHGAVATLSFVDCGLPSTAGVEDVAPVAKRILRSIEREAGQELDVVVAEMGDGIIGCYGVDSILKDAEFRSMIRAHVFCANDLVAAWGGVRWLEGIDLAVNVLAGPATDNQVGVRYIEGDLGIPAANARTDPDRYVDLVEEAAFARTA
jgi:hypothetical protein